LVVYVFTRLITASSAPMSCLMRGVDERLAGYGEDVECGVKVRQVPAIQV
jgi:hypothetical protein